MHSGWLSQEAYYKTQKSLLVGWFAAHFTCYFEVGIGWHCVGRYGHALALVAGLALGIELHLDFACATGRNWLMWPSWNGATARTLGIADDEGFFAGVGELEDVLYHIALFYGAEFVLVLVVTDRSCWARRYARCVDVGAGDIAALVKIGRACSTAYTRSRRRSAEHVALTLAEPVGDAATYEICDKKAAYQGQETQLNFLVPFHVK
jgi:hypothetical protein